jgi:hypothetical protein
MQKAAVLLIAAALGAGAQPRQKTFWLDAAPKQWNRPGSAIPKARRLFGKDDQTFLEQCRASILANANLPEQRAVAEKGWMLIATTRDGRGVTVVSGTQDFDGMCRPVDYQDFVFMEGKYAGTTSPRLMSSRGDGASSRIGFPAPEKMSVEFVRYSERDPLCCPSRISEASYEIEDREGKPVAILSSVRTRIAN